MHQRILKSEIKHTKKSLITNSYTSILLMSKGFDFDALTGFGKNGAITVFAIFYINFDDVEIELPCLPLKVQDYL